MLPIRLNDFLISLDQSCNKENLQYNSKVFAKKAFSTLQKDFKGSEIKNCQSKKLLAFSKKLVNVLKKDGALDKKATLNKASLDNMIKKKHEDGNNLEEGIRFNFNKIVSLLKFDEQSLQQSESLKNSLDSIEKANILNVSKKDEKELGNLASFMGFLQRFFLTQDSNESLQLAKKCFTLQKRLQEFKLPFGSLKQDILFEGNNLLDRFVSLVDHQGKLGSAGDAILKNLVSKDLALMEDLVDNLGKKVDLISRHLGVNLTNKTKTFPFLTQGFDFIADKQNKLLFIENDNVGKVGLELYASSLQGEDLEVPITDFKSLNWKFSNALSLSDSQDILKQLVHRTTLVHREKQSEMRIQLEPSILGKAQIKLLRDEGGLFGSFIVENESVKLFLEDNLHSLKEALGNKGVHFGRLEVLLGGQSENDSSHFLRDRVLNYPEEQRLINDFLGDADGDVEEEFLEYRSVDWLARQVNLMV